MKAVLIFLLYLTKCSVAHVYWKDYDGSIPPDAIKGGITYDGYGTYIGLIGAMDEETIGTPDMVSATIYYNDSYGYAAYHYNVYKSKKGVKIMATSQPDKYHWKYPMEVTFGCTLVRGSYTNPWENYYIGQAPYNGQIVSGRFTIDGDLIVPQRIPDSLLVLKNYAMLVYCE